MYIQQAYIVNKYLLYKVSIGRLYKRLISFELLFAVFLLEIWMSIVYNADLWLRECGNGPVPLDRNWLTVRV